MFPVSIKGVLLVDNDKAVLAMNDRGEWELPGGRIEVGEDPETCVQREFEEELGVKVFAEQIIDSYLFEVIPGGRFQASCRIYFVGSGCFS